MVRVRFAPSPTGFLHLGSARTALFNWLYARHTGGKFFLRIEDTDLVRSEERFLDEILFDLKWMGLGWDSEPVYQSKRFGIYREKAEEILSSGRAYREGEATIFKVESDRTVEIDDAVHGKVSFDTGQIKDQVMIKSDGSPAYNFSCVVDDAEMGITHIIRGDDHLSNTPKQVLFYDALGAGRPSFCHIPLMMGADGAKLSKRHGAVAVEEYRKQGFLPEALANYLLLLGWSPKDGKELIPLAEAVKVFDIKDIGDVQARFDMQKLTWLNGEYIMSKSCDELLGPLKDVLAERGIDMAGVSDDHMKKVIALYHVRMKVFSDFADLADLFFTDNYIIEKEGAKHLEGDANRSLLSSFLDVVTGLGGFSHQEIEAACRAFAEEKGLKMGRIVHPVRMAISGKTRGAGLFEMMEVLGRDKVVKRLRKVSS